MVEVQPEGKLFYKTYNAVNKDSMTWKAYPEFNSISYNDRGMAELKFNLSDAYLLGTKNHKDRMDVVETRYQVRFDYRRFLYDIHLQHRTDPDFA